MNPKDLAGATRAPLHLLPAVGIIHGAMGCFDGAVKYGPYNWREEKISLFGYLGALERHLQKLKDGEWFDKNDPYGGTHLGHIIATSAIILDAYHCDTLINDLPEQNGAAADVLEEIENMLEEMAADQGKSAKECVNVVDNVYHLSVDGSGAPQPEQLEKEDDD